AGSTAFAFDGDGNGVALFTISGDLYANSYTKATNAWGAAKLLENLPQAVTLGSLSVSANGAALAIWKQSVVNGSATEVNVYARRYVNGTWQLNNAGQEMGELL